MFLRDSEVCIERCDSYSDFSCLTKNWTFLFEEKFVRENIFLLFNPDSGPLWKRLDLNGQIILKIYEIFI